MMTTRLRSKISSEPGSPAIATRAPHPEWTLTPIAADFKLHPHCCICCSKTESQCQLHLPRIKNGPRRAITWVGRAFEKTLGCRTSLRCGIEITEIRRAINGIEIFHVYGVEKVERFSNGFHAEALSGFKDA